MITNLHIKNIGIIDDLSIDLNNGLNILTGETGAGKTLIIDSLGIISGERFSKEMIRNGEEYSYVEACLYLPDNSLASDGNIIVSREIYSNGRNMCKINGRMVTVNELKEFMKSVIDIHGQHDNQNILDIQKHIDYLDKYIYKDISSIKEEYQDLFIKYNELNIELKNNYGDEKEKRRKLDLLKYQLNEIEIANLKLGEDEQLENDRNIILNSEKISENLNLADYEVSENAIESINKAIRALEKIEGFDENYYKILSNLKSVYYDLQENGREIRNLREETYFDEEQREYIEKRLDLIFTLKRKYGNSIEEILKYKDELTEEINTIENLEEYNNKLKEQINIISSKMDKLSEELTQIRNERSIELEIKVNNELKDLEMKNATLKIDIKNTNEYNKNGKNEVQFLICTNIGENYKPLVKIASGGEMSRIMLAIKNVLSNVDTIPVLIFDEIDTGISGKAANSVATKLKSISKNHQVLCVTHLASIAAKGNYNYYINKETVENNKTQTKIKLLSVEEKEREIARIASGAITEISLKHAKMLIEK